MDPKDTDSKLQKSGVIYKYKYPQINCTEECIGESGRTFEDRYKEHLKAPSPIHLHTTTTGHPVSPDCFSIVDRDSQRMVRNIKEVKYIRVNDPSQQKPGKVPAFTCMGSSTAKHTNTSSIVTLTIPSPSIMPQHLPPLDTPILPQTHGWGHIFHLIGK